MINIEYVNGTISMESNQIAREFNTFMESSENDINKMYTDFTMIQEKVALEAAIMGSASDDLQMMYESERKNVFARIGEMVISLYKKFVEMLDKLIDKVQEIAFGKKTDLQKLELLIKKHPDLKNEVISAASTGALDLQDARSLKDLEEAFDEILKMAKKQDVDPNTLKGKWEKAKEKFKKATEDGETVKKAAGTATAVLTLAILLREFGPKCAKAKNDYIESKKKARQEEAEILEMLKHDPKSNVDDNTGKWFALLQIARVKNGMIAAAHNKTNSKLVGLMNRIAQIADKYDKVGGEKFHYNKEHEYVYGSKKKP